MEFCYPSQAIEVHLGLSLTEKNDRLMSVAFIARRLVKASHFDKE